MRIAIFGSGGVGGYFGGRLAKSGEDVTFIARGEHLRALRESGLKVDSLAGNFTIHPVKATDNPATAGHVDLIIVGVKAWQVSEAAHAMKPMVGPNTIVLPLQNGVDAPAELAAILGAEHVLGGLCRIVSFVVGPGHIRHAGFEPTVVLGELNNEPSARSKQIHEAFVRAEINTSIAADFNLALWTKFLFIASFSGVGALTGESAGGLRTNPATRAQLVSAMQEIFELGRALKVDLPDDAVASGMANVDSLPPEGTSSMQRDIAAERPSELESQNGAVVRMAREIDLKVPTHELIYSSLKPLEMKARGRERTG